MTGAKCIVEFLERMGVTDVFSVPGTQNLQIFEALRNSEIRTVVATDEMAAGFMANGYYRATGKPGVLVVIPGPGLTYAVTPLAEALADSVGVFAITVYEMSRQEDLRFRLQGLDQQKLLSPVTKEYFSVSDAGQLPRVLARSFSSVLTEEPGPVVLDIARELLTEKISAGAGYEFISSEITLDELQLNSFYQRVLNARRPVLFCGQGAIEASADIVALAEKLNSPVIVTCSGRGIIPDDHRLSFVRDFSFGIGGVVPEILSEADLVCAFGCKFSHNGCAGFSLNISPEKLIHVDSSLANLVGPYSAALKIHLKVEVLLPILLARQLGESDWNKSRLEQWRKDLASEVSDSISYLPDLADRESDIKQLFESLQQAVGREAIYITDSGFHQALVRTFVSVRKPRKLICPTDFQSMGFGIPAAIGAKIAKGGEKVISIVGDGGFIQTAAELLTAVREKCAMLVVVMNDESLGLIRRQQLLKFGYEFGTKLINPNFEALTLSLGCKYQSYQGPESLEKLDFSDGVLVLEVRLQDSESFRKASGSARRKTKLLAVPGIRKLWGWVKQFLKGTSAD